MQQINGYWVDENNNRWACSYYTAEQAEEYSATLINCLDCRNCEKCLNCVSCRDCQDCRNCRFCRNCENCENCRNCENCENCRFCRNCENCENCRDCRNCENCRGCGDCRGCWDCKNYQDNPQRYVTPRIGSRNDNTTIYWLDGDVQIVCGCFRGDLDEFEARVREVHGDNEHGRAYMTEIAKVRALMQ